MNIPTKYLLLIFIPIILVTGSFFYINYLQYKPLYPETEKNKKEKQTSEIPILAGDVILGKKTAPKTIVAFEDLGCNACKEQHELLNKLIEKHSNKVKVVWKGLPIKKFPHSSDLAHKYAFCVNKQGKFEKFTELAFANSNNLSESVIKSIVNKMKINQNRLKNCLNSDQPDNYIQKTKKLAKFLNIQAVPATFVNGQQIDEPGTISGWETKLKL